MKAAFGRLLLRRIGRAFEADHPEPLCGNSEYSTRPLEAAVNPEVCLSTRWQFARVGLKPGWYMLEVEHTADSIGCVLTLQSSGSSTAHLRLGSKKVCKRVVWFAERVSELAISIDQADCTLNRVTLIALTSTFAMSRVQQRLENRGSSPFASADTAAAVYDHYQANLHGSIFSKPYRFVEREVTSACEDIHRIGGRQAIVNLKLLRNEADDAPLCDSVNEAMHYARKLGWSVEWQIEVKALPSEESKEGRSTYLMPVQSGVCYQLDVMHRLLDAVCEDTVIVYADHDHVGKDNQHSNPVLKPDWNPELLLNFNYIDLPYIVSERWFCLVTAGLPVEECSGDASLLAAALGRYDSPVKNALSDAVTGEQTSRNNDSFVPALVNGQVSHVPEILASRIMTQPPIKQNVATEKSSWHHSVQLALEKAGYIGTVLPGKLPGFTRVSWPLPSDLPAVAIIVPTRDKVGVLRKCLESVLSRTQYPNYRIIVVDNDSTEAETEQYYQSLESEQRVRLIRYEQPFNYSAINNFAVGCTNAPVLVLLNNDTEVISANWLDELVRQALRPGVGCVGAKLYYSNGRIQHAGVVVGITGVAGHAFRYEKKEDEGYCGRLQTSQNYTAVTAACLAVRRDTYSRVGGFDQDDLSVAWNDVDFCMKVEASGLRNVWTPYAELFHHEGLSRGSDDTPEKVQRVNTERRVMMSRWSLDEFKDAAYHPLLTTDNENFGLGKAIT